MKIFYKSVSIYDVPHPWYHAFFTYLISYGSDGSYYHYQCSKCNKVYTLKPKPIESLEVEVKGE